MSNKDQDLSFWQNKDWEKMQSKPMLLFCVVTHEIRSSMTNEQLAPFVRINDGKMHVMEIENTGKVGTLKFLTKM